MKYLSVCSGIEAASVAWHSLGWSAVAFSEIDPFPCSVLHHRFPQVPNWGDMTRFKEWPDATIDALVGGTPCQSFSMAGLRRGLDDPRGSLMLTYLGIARRYRPRWIVWENVPGVLSSNGGRDFGTFLGALGELGYGWAYRVLDAQFFGVPQRRRRVFVVGCLGDGERAARVLFESESVRRDSAKSRAKREDTAATIAPCLTGSGRGVGRTGESRGQDPVVAVVRRWPADTAQCLDTTFGTKYGQDDQHIDSGASLFVHGNYVPKIVGQAMSCKWSKGSSGPAGDEHHNLVTHALTRRHDSSEDGCGRGTPLVPVAFHPMQDPISSRDVVHAIQARGQATAAVMFDLKNVTSKTNQSNPQLGDPSHTLAASNARDAVVTLQAKQHCSVEDPMIVDQGAMRIRRLTPRECERLQGFPDDWTLVPHRRKPAKNGPRYRAIGNSMAVPVMRWIGERIANVDKTG